MAVVRLKAKEVLHLEGVLRTATDPRPLQRAQAMMRLEGGDRGEEGADRLQVTPQSVYNWIARFAARADRARAERASDGPRAGRPRTALEIIDPLIDASIETDPRAVGSHSAVWAIPL
jgi:hypothetical protein